MPKNCCYPIMDMLYSIYGGQRDAPMATLNQPLAGIVGEKPADLSSKEVLKRLSPAAVKAFLKIRELWELRDEDARQLLGGISNGAFYELKKKRVSRLTKTG